MKAFSSVITKRNRPKKIWVDKGSEYAGASKKFCAAEGIQVYSTMSETKAAFAEPTIRYLKIILHMEEDFGDKYKHKLPQFSTTLNSRPNKLIDLRPNIVKIATLCLFFIVKLYENIENLHSEPLIVCKAQSMTSYFAKITSRSLHEKFLKL